MRRTDVLTTARFAGSVQRWHTWPLLRPQTIGEHSWQVSRIYYEVFGPLPPEVSTYILWHDAGELVLGDLPFPVKANNPDLKCICDSIEANSVIGMGGTLPELSTVQKLCVKCADLLDMLEVGQQEAAMGNRFAQPIIEDVTRSLEQLLPQLPIEEELLVARYMRRMSTLLGG